MMGKKGGRRERECFLTRLAPGDLCVEMCVSCLPTAPFLCCAEECYKSTSHPNDSDERGIYWFMAETALCMNKAHEATP